MQQCHFCKGFFPIEQLSTIEGYFPDGRVRHVSWSCDSCLNGVFQPAKLANGDSPEASIEAWEWWQAQEAHGNDIEE